MGDIVNEDGFKIPNHVAIILDGNGRWAKKRLMPRNYGHAQGSKTVEKICEEAHRMGIKYLTVYAFSTENWNRPEDEVEALMKLLRSYMKDCIKTSNKNNMRVRVIGDIRKLPNDLQASILELEKTSEKNTGLNFQVALNYGGRDEIIRAIKKLYHDINNEKISLDNIDSKLISEYLDTKEIPDPDLLIRTSGEQRISNFLLWQLAYTEFYFTDVLWPDFDKKELIKAIEYYNSRERRYGLI
jgi:undecaprenyl diphosphate synthase